jgi:hypothetical protein
LLLTGVIYRILESAALQREVQEWSGRYWLPSLLPVHRLAAAPAAPAEVLAAAGIPRSDWTAWPNRTWMTPELVRLTRPPESRPKGPDPQR